MTLKMIYKQHRDKDKALAKDLDQRAAELRAQADGLAAAAKALRAP